MRNKKIMRILALLLLTALLPLGVLAQDSASLNEDIVAKPGEDDSSLYIGGIANLGDTVYALSYRGLYRWQIGQQELTLAAPLDYAAMGAEEGESVLQLGAILSDGQRLWGMDGSEGRLFTVDIAEGQVKFGQPIPIDLEDRKVTYESDDAEHSYLEMPEQMVIQDGVLYALFGNYQTGNQNRTLMSFDMQTGEATAYQAEFITGIAAYKEGKLLASVLDEENSYDEMGNRKPTALCTFDPAADALEEIGVFADVNAGSMGMGITMIYEAEQDAVLYLTPNAIIRRFADGTEEKCAYMPMQELWGGFGHKLLLLSDGRIAFAQENTLYLRSTNPKDLPATNLVIYNLEENGAHKKALQQMPDVSVTALQNKWFSSSQELGQALVSGEDGIDIIFLQAGWMDLQNLLEKGYAADLTQSPALKEHMDKLYPDMKTLGMQQDKVMALPVRADLETMSLNSKVFEKTGLPLPETFADICATATAFYQTLAEEGEYNLNSQTGGEWLKELMMNTYSDYCVYTQQEALLDTPVFREMAAALASAPLQTMQEDEVDYSDNEAMNEFFNRPTLLNNNYYFDLQSYHYFTTQDEDSLRAPDLFFGLKATQDAPPVIRVNTTVMLINSKSKNLDAALRYAENYIKNLEPMNRIMLYPGDNEPVIDPEFERIHARMLQQKEITNEALKKAEGAEKTELETRLAMMEENIVSYEKFGKYLASENAITAYRKLMEHHYVVTVRNSLLTSQEELIELRYRYFAGQLTLDQFIQESDAKLKLIQLENQ